MRISFVQLGVLGLGLATFVALLLAPRTVLEDDAQTENANAVENSENTAANPEMTGQMPAFDAESVPLELPEIALSEEQRGEINGLLVQYEKSTADAEKTRLLRQIADWYASNAFWGYAGRYRQLLAEQTKDTSLFLVAAKHFTKAAKAADRQQDVQLKNSVNAAAIRNYNTYLAANPNDRQTLIALAVREVNSPVPMTGIFKLRDIVEADPDNYDANLQLGNFSVRTNQLEKAEQRYRAAINGKPEDFEAHLRLGLLLQEMPGRAQEAQQLLQAARTYAASDEERERLDAALRSRQMQ